MVGLALLAGACGGKSEGRGGDEGTGVAVSESAGSEAGTASPSTDGASSSAVAESTTEGAGASAGEGSADGGVSDTGTGASAADAGGSGEASGGISVDDPGTALDCGGRIYACGDGTDNDGDGLTDLLDLECTGPCDDDEGTFATGIPGDNKDCKQDCFFDGNSGAGDDGCDWSLRCDPENPGANIGCEYRESNSCGGMAATQSEACIDYCLPLTPPGCDCFGCCEVDTPEGSRTIFLNSHPECSLENLDACQPCTQSTDCMNDCEADQCERCFGDEELPPECDPTEQTCDTGEVCVANEDCPDNWFCLLGCCYPPPAG